MIEEKIGMEVNWEIKYVIGTEQRNFMNGGLREPILHTDYRMILAEICGEGVTRNKRHRWGRTWWPVWRIIHSPQLER